MALIRHGSALVRATGRARLPLAALFLAGVAIPVAASLAAPEIPRRAPGMLRAAATHAVTGTVQRIYLAEARDGRWAVREHLAELRVDGVEKAPEGGPWSSETLPDGPLYVRWMTRSYRKRWWWSEGPAPLSSNGHHGWTPEAGDRVRVYLARRAHDGFHTAEQNGDGGFNVLHPNGFERLLEPGRGEQSRGEPGRGDPGEPGDGEGARPPR